MAENFSKIYKKEAPDIRNELNSARKEQIRENSNKLIPINNTIILCGRQEIALRRTNDSGVIQFDGTEPLINDGNFRALLRMRYECGDQNLIKHAQNLAHNATYYSPTIQNEIISICGEMIQKQIANAINSAVYFSILADETTDITRQEQMSLCVRYVEQKDNIFTMHEEFLAFVSVECTKGEYLANTIISTLKSLKINCENMIGQGYDGAASMKGNFNGVQAVIRKTYPEAVYIHCSSHSLNLALAHTCQIQPIRNAIGVINSIGHFFKCSAKRTSFLKDKIKKNHPETRGKILIAMRETRWVENHDGLLRFKEVFMSVAECLEELSFDMDADTSSKASAFHKTMSASDFVISLCCLNELFSYTLPLCKSLQSTSCDLFITLQHVDLVVQKFENIRSTVDEKFKVIFEDAKKLLTNVDEVIKIPRISLKQRNRTNIETEDPETYFRVAIMIPLLDDFISEMDLKFRSHKTTLTELNNLIPTICKRNSNIRQYSFSFYKKKLNYDTLAAELDLWQLKWQKYSGEDVPSTAMQALPHCPKDIYENVHTLLRIMVTLPVTTCSSERSFSTLRRLKSF